MLLNETEACSCRYGNCVNDLWGNWEVIYENSVCDYQGSVDFVAKHPNENKYVAYGYYYGSCSGCDSWEAENLSGDEIKKVMKEQCLEFDNKVQLQRWAKMLMEQGRGVDEKTKAILAYLAISEFREIWEKKLEERECEYI